MKIEEIEVYENLINEHHHELRKTFSVLGFIKIVNQKTEKENFTVNFINTEESIKYGCFFKL